MIASSSSSASHFATGLADGLAILGHAEHAESGGARVRRSEYGPMLGRFARLSMKASYAGCSFSAT